MTTTLGLSFVLMNAQVTINPGTQVPISNHSISLQFYGSDYKGLVLPYVKEADADIGGAERGTFILDPESQSVKFKLASGNWFDLSGDASKQTLVSTTIQDDKTENMEATVIIGENTSVNTPGILVLSDSNKAMVLPKVPNPELNIVNPAAGMLVFDSQNKMLAVFNGSQWSFWKP